MTHKATFGGGFFGVVQVIFDSELISYRDLVEVFLISHDPTKVDGQGADIGHNIVRWLCITATNSERLRKMS